MTSKSYRRYWFLPCLFSAGCWPAHQGTKASRPLINRAETRHTRVVPFSHFHLLDSIYVHPPHHFSTERDIVGNIESPQITCLQIKSSQSYAFRGPWPACCSLNESTAPYPELLITTMATDPATLISVGSLRQVVAYQDSSHTL